MEENEVWKESRRGRMISDAIDKCNAPSSGLVMPKPPNSAKGESGASLSANKARVRVSPAQGMKGQLTMEAGDQLAEILGAAAAGLQFNQEIHPATDREGRDREGAGRKGLNAVGGEKNNKDNRRPHLSVKTWLTLSGRRGRSPRRRGSSGDSGNGEEGSGDSCWTSEGAQEDHGDERGMFWFLKSRIGGRERVLLYVSACTVCKCAFAAFHQHSWSHSLFKSPHESFGSHSVSILLYDAFFTLRSEISPKGSAE